MSNIINKTVEIGTFGLVDDVTGVEEGQKAARKAGDIQAQASLAGVDEQRRQFDVTQQNLQPFSQAGADALNQQRILLGLGGSAVEGQDPSTLSNEQQQQQAFNQFSQSPGQKFLQDRAQKNLVRNASAIGGLGGGNVRSALVEQGAGFAQQDFNNQFGRLGQLAGQGQAATTNIGQLGQQTAQGIAGGLQNASNARASGLLGAQQQEAQFNQGLFQLGGAFLGAS